MSSTPPDPAVADTAAAETTHDSSAGDDMLDGPEIAPPGSQLGKALEIVRGALTPMYITADNAAMIQNRRHRMVVRVATISGALAVLLAILQLAEPIRRVVPHWLEALLAVIAVTAVAFGLAWHLHSSWLRERHKAERCRFLKYRFLLDPGLWDAGLVDWTLRLERAARDIAAITMTDVRQWIEEDISLQPPKLPAATRDNEQIQSLIRYYLDRRLGLQLTYLGRQIQSSDERDRITRQLPTELFFLSVIAAMAHFVLHWFERGSDKSAHGLSSASLVLILIAACLPVIGAAIRSYRGAHEFTRNRTRFRAKYFAVKDISMRLPDERPAAALLTIWHAEQMLESEHREWLRLMSDAEWIP